MIKTEYVIGEIYEIVEIGKTSAWYPLRDNLIGKKIVLTEIEELPKNKGDFGMFGGVFIENFNYTDRINEKKRHMKKCGRIYSYQIKLKKV